MRMSTSRFSTLRKGERIVWYASTIESSNRRRGLWLPPIALGQPSAGGIVKMDQCSALARPNDPMVGTGSVEALSLRASGSGIL